MTVSPNGVPVKRTAAFCQLPYPDRFFAAQNFVEKPPSGATKLTDETQLLLYALSKQATVGPCKEAKPWAWNAVESAKWQSWNSLADMPAMDAMRLFVRTLEEDQHDWWTLVEPETSEPQVEPPDVPLLAPVPEKAKTPEPQGMSEWIAIEVSGGKKPCPRYEQAAAILGSRMFLIGGHYGGRYLGDVWMFDFAKKEWTPTVMKPIETVPTSTEPSTPVPPPPQPLPASAGHTATPWKDTVVLVGGHLKNKDTVPGLIVRVLDANGLVWSLLSIEGEQPVARGGHSATLVGSELYIFGGEDVGRRALNDLQMLDLVHMTWTKLKPKNKGPSPRSTHAATCVLDRYLVIFGGGSVATCYNDFWVLDLHTLQWSQPIVKGGKPTPRAGHAAAMLGNQWYIVGGGNNVKGCTDMLVADLSLIADGEVSWEVLATIPARSALSSEGISLVSTTDGKSLVAFGGYNGKYTNTVSVYTPGTPGAQKPATQQPARHANSSSLKAGAAAAQEATQPVGPAVAAVVKADGSNGSATAAAVTIIRSAKDFYVAAPPTTPTGPLVPPPTPMERPQVADMQAKYDAEVESLSRQLVESRAQLAIAVREAESAVQEAAASKESASHELVLIRRQLTAAQTQASTAEQELADARSLLQAEQNKVLRLEAQIAELHERLQSMEDLEKELQKYRREEKESEQHKKSGGIWGYISGQS